MTISFFDSPLRGIVPPLITPLAEPGRVDRAALGGLVEHVLDGGVHGLFILGTTAEAPSLSGQMRREVIETATRHVGKRVPVLVGITDTSADESVALAGCAADAGADAVVLAPPPYFPLSQVEFVAYVRRLLPRLPLPVYLYNMPACVKLHLEIDTLTQLLDLPGVAGFKDSSGDMGYFHRARGVVDRERQSLLIGPEELLGESVMLGGDGGVAGGANLFPRLYVDLYDAAVRGDLAEVQRRQQIVMQITRGIYGVGQYGTRVIQGLKAALSLAGLCRNVMAEPFSALPPADVERVRQALETLPAVALSPPPVEAVTSPA